MSGKRFLQIVSDVHLECIKKGNLPIIQKHGTDLTLLGDIGKPCSKAYKEFLAEQSRSFRSGNVFVIMGNHEYYSSDRTKDAILQHARHVCTGFPNVHLLDRDSYPLTAKTTLLGCTLWSSINQFASTRLNDFVKIKVDNEEKIRGPITREMYNEWHRRDVRWIEREVDRCDAMGRNVVVLTHHAPLEVMSGRYVGSPINSAFTSDLSHLFEPPVIGFANGHVHSNCDVIFKNIRCVSNAMGYPYESDVGYKENVVMEID